MCVVVTAVLEFSNCANCDCGARIDRHYTLQWVVWLFMSRCLDRAVRHRPLQYSTVQCTHGVYSTHTVQRYGTIHISQR